MKRLGRELPFLKGGAKAQPCELAGVVEICRNLGKLAVRELNASGLEAVLEPILGDVPLVLRVLAQEGVAKLGDL